MLFVIKTLRHRVIEFLTDDVIISQVLPWVFKLFDFLWRFPCFRHWLNRLDCRFSLNLVTFLMKGIIEFGSQFELVLPLLHYSRSCSFLSRAVPVVVRVEFFTRGSCFYSLMPFLRLKVFLLWQWLPLLFQLFLTNFLFLLFLIIDGWSWKWISFL